MKTTSITFALIVAFLIAAFGIFYFVHPVLVLTLKDILWIVIIDAFLAFFANKMRFFVSFKIGAAGKTGGRED